MVAKTRLPVNLRTGFFSEFMSPVKTIASVASIILISGCMNMSTHVDNITPVMDFDAEYLNYDCDKLASMLTRVKLEERELTQKQKNRGSDSLGHALYYGWGKGDGMDTVELIKARRAIFSIERSIATKNCM